MDHILEVERNTLNSYVILDLRKKVYYIRHMLCTLVNKGAELSESCTKVRLAVIESELFFRSFSYCRVLAHLG